jgi:hypothetical protein
MKDKAPILNSFQHKHYEWTWSFTYILVTASWSKLERDLFVSEQRY